MRSASFIPPLSCPKCSMAWVLPKPKAGRCSAAWSGFTPLANRQGWRPSTRRSGSLQPPHHLGGIRVRRKHRVKHFYDRAVAYDQRDALDEPHGIDFERRQFQCFGKLQFFIAQYLEWQVQPFHGFLLVSGVLGGETKEFRHAELL